MIRKIRAAWRVVVKEKGKLINWPNGLTMLRVVSVFFICSYIQQGIIFWAVWLFSFAAITDFFDGWIARKHKQETKVGEFLDQAADKLLVIATLYYLDKVDYIDLWPWIIKVILVREFVIGAGRLLILDTKIGETISTNRLGQIKATAQYIGIPWTMLRWPSFNWIMAVVAILTLISGMVYAMNFLLALKIYVIRLKDILTNNKRTRN